MSPEASPRSSARNAKATSRRPGRGPWRSETASEAVCHAGALCFRGETMRPAFVLALLGLVALGCSEERSSSPPAASRAVENISAESTVVRLEVWHDTVCPWCAIGLHNLDTALSTPLSTPTQA